MKANEFDEVQLDKHMNEVDRQQYQDYTGRVISYMDENGRNTYPLKRVCLKKFSLFILDFLLNEIQAVVDEMKRFDQLNQGYKKTDTPTNTIVEKKSDNPNIQTLDETKKHMGFQWNKPNQS